MTTITQSTKKGNLCESHTLGINCYSQPVSKHLNNSRISVFSFSFSFICYVNICIYWYVKPVTMKQMEISLHCNNLGKNKEKNKEG